MSYITNKNVENLPNDDQQKVQDVGSVDKVDPMQAQTFSDLVKDKEEAELADAAEATDEITPEELQRQIRDNLFRNGFNRAIERAREMAKEMKDG
ncbi:hypothetical protein [Endozoicomonas ascidiicola]|uniref:hypothetical protein n=1 Tax=Endozoicomonas ascidiicola TaxID=1698521 RepID=UPI000831D15E|nr:hypothetical protein [Endozoicomonas ascidiicola]